MLPEPTIAAGIRAATSPSSKLDHQVELDRRVERQRRHADGGARVSPRVAEYGAEQLGRAVGDLWLLGEVRGRRDEDRGLHDASHVRQVTAGSEGCQRVQRALSRTRLTLPRRHARAELALREKLP